MDWEEGDMNLLLLGLFLWMLGFVLLFVNIFLISTARSDRTWHWNWFLLSLAGALAFCARLLPGQAGDSHGLFTFYALSVPMAVIGQFAVLLVQRIRAKRKLRAFQALLSSDAGPSNSGQHDPLAS
jgi:hypothetical protein